MSLLLEASTLGLSCSSSSPVCVCVCVCVYAIHVCVLKKSYHTYIGLYTVC